MRRDDSRRDRRQFALQALEIGWLVDVVPLWHGWCTREPESRGRARVWPKTRGVLQSIVRTRRGGAARMPIR